MKKISSKEQEAIIAVLAAGAEFGYGNMMAHLATRWAKMLIEEWGLPEEAAREASLHPGYPFIMQRDMIVDGEYDETGGRYRKSQILHERKQEDGELQPPIRDALA